MAENVAVHSNKHFEYLLEDSETYDPDKVDTDVDRPLSSQTETKSQKFDMLTLGKGHDADIESHYDMDLQFVNQEESKMLETAVDDRREDFVNRAEELERLEELKRHYRKLEEDYGNMERSDVVDSLEMPSFGQEVHNPQENYDQEGYLSHPSGSHFQIQGHIEENHASNSKKKIYIDDASNFRKDEEREKCKPKPGFKYKEPIPKFVAKNKVEVGKRSQGSYCQKFLLEKGGSSKSGIKTGHNISHSPLTGSSKQNETGAIENYGLKHTRDVGFVVQPDPVYQSGYGYAPKKEIMQPSMPFNMVNSARAANDLEMSNLDIMIKEEELNLRNNILDSSPPHIRDIQNADVQHYSPRYSQLEHFQTEHQYNRAGNIDSSLHQPTHLISNQKEEDLRNSSYAKRHILTFDKQSTSPNDGHASYAAQHLDKKKEVSYKKYSVKDYRALNKDIKLQRSLGPDKASEEYLEKKAKADKLKDYASAVSSYNKQRLVLKKAKSAPMPTIKDRQLESKRTAALEYARKIGKQPRKTPKGHEKLRPSSEKTERISALEVMRQRHESEKLAIDEMRQNLANIIKVVKS